VVGRKQWVVRDFGLNGFSADITKFHCHLERCLHPRMRGCNSDCKTFGVGLVIRPIVDICNRIRRIWQPGIDADPPSANGDKLEPFGQ